MIKKQKNLLLQKTSSSKGDGNVAKVPKEARNEEVINIE